MIDRSSGDNQMSASTAASAAERPALLRLAWRESYFSAFFYAYAPASGRCFAPGRIDRK